MSKYKEQNVVVIKRDIQKFSEELRHIIEQISEKKVEREAIIRSVEREKAQLDSVINSKSFKITQKIEEIRKLEETKANLLAEIEGFGSERLSLKGKINLLTDLLNEAVAELSEIPSTIYIDDLVRESRKILEKIQKDTFSAKAELSKTRELSASEQAALAALASEKKILIDKIMTLRAGEAVKKEEMTGLQQELMRVEGRIATIEKREKDVRIMEERMTPAYQEFYKATRLKIKHLNDNKDGV